MKLLLTLLLFSISQFGFSKDKIIQLNKADEIAIHNSIQTTLSEIKLYEITINDSIELKRKLTNIVLDATELGSLNKKTYFESDHDFSIYITYDYDNYRYYYHIPYSDSTLNFNNLELDFSKYSLIEDDNTKLISTYSFQFNYDSNLSKLDFKEFNSSRFTQYNYLGQILNHKLIIDGYIVGNTYEKIDFSSEIEYNLQELKLKDWNTRFSSLVDHNTKTDSLKCLEYIINGLDTIAYSIGYLDKLKQMQKRGQWLTYYKNGNIALTHTYALVNEKYFYRNGKEIYFYENGDTAIIANYKSGNLDGKRTAFYRGNNQESIQYYNNGTLSGKQTTFFEDGGKSYRYYTNYGKRAGTWLVYDAQNRIEKQLNYKNDELNGIAKTYSNEILIDSSFYVNGFRENTRIHYYDQLDNKNQKIVNEISNYKKGNLDGIYLSYFINGRVADSSFYSSGEKDGKSTEFFLSGALSKEAFYDKGETLSFTTFFENGQKKQVYLLDKETEYSTDTIFYDNGIISNVESYDERNGKIGNWFTQNKEGEFTSRLLYEKNNNTPQGYILEVDDDRLDSAFYDSKLMTRTIKRYYDSKLFSEYTVRYGIPISLKNSNWDKKEEKGLLTKTTYHVDLSYLDEEEEYEKSYKNESIVGEETSYYLNGAKKQVIITMDPGDEWASKVNYYKNGTIKQIMQNPNWDSYKIAAFNEKGQILSHKSEDIELAIFYDYYENGNLKSKTRYESDFLSQTNYYENGNLKYKLEKEESGEYDFYDNKYEDYSEFYTKKEMFYDENGILSEERYSYYNDEEKIIRKYKNGKLESIESYEDYEGIGYPFLKSFKTFYSDGSIKSIKLYEFSEVLYENIIVFQKQFYESGGIKLEKHWDENGLKSGSWIYYNDDEVRDEAGEIIQDATIIEKH